MGSETTHIAGADAPFDIVWDDTGVAHVYATTVADAYRGMGYAAASERLWQIHLSCAYANSEAAALLGERFVPQDAIQSACNVDGKRTGLVPSDGDWIADAYLEGMNSYVRALDAPPPEFVHAGTEPREFTRADVAARYRFTSWFQHKSWTEKMMLGRLMATHSVRQFRGQVLHFSREDAAQISLHGEALRNIDPAPLSLAYPINVPPALSGSNNWAIRGELSASGKPMLATDPHQPHTIPNTFFYVHLHAGDWDAFGAAFPGVPYFMMGYTRDIAWGLTTGFVDSYDVYMEHIHSNRARTADGWEDLTTRSLRIATKGGGETTVDVDFTRHGPLLESLMNGLGRGRSRGSQQTALRWALADAPTSAGALARLPLAKTTEEFGNFLFEDDVCPLVNNIIAVDSSNNLERFMATTLPARSGVTGSVPLTGWNAAHDFPLSRAADLKVEKNPARGYTHTANNDTMGETGPYTIHNFPTSSARADRIAEVLDAGSTGGFTSDDFAAMQLDLTDLRARHTVPHVLSLLEGSEDADVALARELLAAWDYRADAAAAAPCLYYPFLDRFPTLKFVRRVLEDEVLTLLPGGAPGLNLSDIAHYTDPNGAWANHREVLVDVVRATMAEVVQRVRSSLGEPSEWQWGALHQVNFWHTLRKHDTWSHMQAGPDPQGGGPTTLGMAMHMGPGPGREEDAPGEIPCRVYHGPAYRLIVDLADPEHARFVIAGGNGGRPDSPFIANQYPQWRDGEYTTLSLVRAELDVERTVSIAPG